MHQVVGRGAALEAAAPEAAAPEDAGEDLGEELDEAQADGRRVGARHRSAAVERRLTASPHSESVTAERRHGLFGHRFVGLRGQP